MKPEKVLVIGLGEIGSSLLQLLMESGKFEVSGFDIDKTKMTNLKQDSLPNTVDTMHICIPFVQQDGFIDIVKKYAAHFRPNLLIINSTVSPGTTKEISENCGRCLVSHSPVRGVHKNLEYMKSELRRYTKYIGGATQEASNATLKHFEKAGLKTKILKSCYETELAKLFETTYRAWMIACFQEMHRISRHFETDFDDVIDFLEDTHRIRLDRPIMFPGIIGGHCLIPNTKLLLEAYDSEFLKLIIKSNDRRKTETRQKDVSEETEKIRKRAESLEKELAEKLKRIPQD